MVYKGGGGGKGARSAKKGGGLAGAIRSRQAAFQMAHARGVNRFTREELRDTNARYHKASPISRRDYQSLNAQARRPQTAAAYKAVRTRYQQTPAAQAKIGAQRARQAAREPGRFPLFGGQTPNQRPR